MKSTRLFIRSCQSGGHAASYLIVPTRPRAGTASPSRGGYQTGVLFLFNNLTFEAAPAASPRFCGDARAAAYDLLVEAKKHLRLWPQAPSVMRAAVSLHLYR